MIRVLVAEDHTIVREGIKQLIGMARDLEVAGEACNGEQLLEVLRRTPCDVVLLDISMPGVNGLEAIPRIRALTEAPAIPGCCRCTTRRRWRRVRSRLVPPVMPPRTATRRC